MDQLLKSFLKRKQCEDRKWGGEGRCLRGGQVM